MANRQFRLPGVEELNKDQDRVLRLPEEGQFLIVGGPGTGKSVVALLRAIKFSDEQNYVFLTYNKVLSQATKQLVGFDLKGGTLHAWFYQLQYALTKKYMPKIGKKSIDYDQVLDIFKTHKNTHKALCILIDEGQDMPIKFYESLIEFGFKNFFIVADQNQQITDENSSRKELADVFGLEVNEVVELKQNYRNSHPVALVAQHFFTDPASPKPDLPQVSNAKLGIPILYSYKEVKKCVRFILREADRDPSHLIGIVIANTKILKILVNELTKMEIELDNPRPIVQYYSSVDKKEASLNFSEGGIVILNDKSIKGLEFDVVFIFINGFEVYNNELDVMRKRFYVMSSRAIKKLVFFKSFDNHKLDSMLPDEVILQRQELS